MKCKLFFLVAFIALTNVIHAQWSVISGSTMLCSGNVGIGTYPRCSLDVSGPINVSAAGVLSPSYTSLGNGLFSHQGVGLGIYSANGGISFWGGGAMEYMRIVNGGNVGIGTAAPYGKLDVRNGSLSVTSSDFVANTTGSVISTKLGASTGNTYGILQVGTGGDIGHGNLSLNPLGGFVGIGTSTPYGKLTVSDGLIATTTNDFSSTNKIGTILYAQLGAPTGNTYGIIQVGNSGNYGATGNLCLNPFGGNVSIGSNANPDAATLYLANSTFPLFILHNPATTEKLQIYVNPSFGGHYATNGTIVAKPNEIVYKASGVTHNLIFEMTDDNNDGNSYIEFADDYNGGWFKIFNNAKVRIDGTVYAKEIDVQANVWADNVFNKDYKLRSLAEIEAYIKANNHLPEVPTEAEVKDKGINLADMNATLLKKIEEITLLLIEQNKSIETLKKENDALKTRVDVIAKK